MENLTGTPLSYLPHNHPLRQDYQPRPDLPNLQLWGSKEENLKEPHSVSLQSAPELKEIPVVEGWNPNAGDEKSK